MDRNVRNSVGRSKVSFRVVLLAAALFVAVLPLAGQESPASAPRPQAATDASPLLVIASIGESHVALVDGTTYRTVTTLPTGKGPHEVRISPDGRYAYVAAGRTITRVGLRERAVLANFDLGSYSAHDIRVSRDGQRIWAACAGAQTILEMDAATGKILKTYPTQQQGSWFVEITPDERTLFTPNLEGKSVSVIDRASSKASTIPFGESVYGIDVTPDGKEVWVTGRDVAVIDPGTNKVKATIKLPEADTGRIRLTSDGEKAVVALEKRLAVIDVKSRGVALLIELSATPKVLTLSSDNRRVFLTNPDDNSVSVVDIVLGKQLTSFKTGTKPDGIGWSD